MIAIRRFAVIAAIPRMVLQSLPAFFMVVCGWLPEPGLAQNAPAIRSMGPGSTVPPTRPSGPAHSPSVPKVVTAAPLEFEGTSSLRRTVTASPLVFEGIEAHNKSVNAAPLVFEGTFSGTLAPIPAKQVPAAQRKGAQK